MRIRIAAIVWLLSLALLAPGSASASSSIQYGVQDDAWLLYVPEPPAQRIQILQRLGVDVVRLTLRWDAVAQSRPADPRDPADPAYRWELYDSILQRVIAPDKIAQSISEAINYQLGFDVTSGWFYKLISRWLLPLTVFGLLVIWGLSCLVVVQPGSRSLNFWLLLESLHCSSRSCCRHWARPVSRR